MQKNKETEVINFGPYLDRTLKQIKQVYTKTFASANIDITTEQWMIIDCLAQKNGQSQKEIAENSFKNAATVSRILDLLSKKNIVERKILQSDKRTYNIYLTKFGLTIYEKIKPLVLQLRKNGWNGLTLNDYENFVKITNKLYDNFLKLI